MRFCKVALLLLLRSIASDAATAALAVFRVVQLVLFVRLSPSFSARKRSFVSAHGANEKHGNGRSNGVTVSDASVCYVDASILDTDDDTGEVRGGISCYYGPGHALNYCARVTGKDCADNNSAEVLAFLACVLRHDATERLTVYTDSRYVLKCVESFRKNTHGNTTTAKERKTRWYAKCVHWALLAREGRTVVHKVKAHAEGNGSNGKKNGGRGSSYAARMNNARADALARYGAKSDVDVFQNLGSFWGIVVAMYRFAARRVEEAPPNTSIGANGRRGRYEDEEDEEDEDDQEERRYYERVAKNRPFGLGALRVVRNGRIINLFDEKEEDKEHRKQENVPSGPPKPLNDDFSVTDCLALDCEMVGTGLGGVKSLLGQVSVINEHLNVVYTSYCRPMETVTDYRTQWSGLTEAHLRDAPSFEEVQNKVMELFGGSDGDGGDSNSNNIPRRIMTGHGLENDLDVLRMTHPKELLRDTATWKPILRPPHFKKPQKLRKLVKIHSNFTIQRTSADGKIGHDPSEDARGSMVLYLKFRSRWEQDIANRGATRANIAPSRYHTSSRK